jgi:hypothetical protein
MESSFKIKNSKGVEAKFLFKTKNMPNMITNVFFLGDLFPFFYFKK